jgi:tetratricopeptide (TPR) repeat protein
MSRLPFALAFLCLFLNVSSYSEEAADILDANAASQPKTAPATAAPETPPATPATAPRNQPLGTVDEPGFKASAKFAGNPAPNYDLGTKSNNAIPVPKKNAWAVPLEDGAANSTQTEKGIEPNSADEKSKSFPEDISPALAGAIAREKAGEKARVMVPVYQAIVNADDQNAAAHYRLGLAWLRSGELQKGLPELETTIALQPKNPKYLCDYGIAALRAGWVEKAFAACNAAVAAAPSNARYLSALGDVHLAAGHLAEAAEAYKRAIEHDSQNSTYLYNLGLAYMHSRDFKHATEIINEAIRMKPNNSAYYCSRGLAFENLKNVKMAIQDYVAAIKLDKNNAYAHYLYAGVFSDPDDPTYTNRFEAVDHAEKAVKLTNYKNAQYLMGLARALRVAHNYEQASQIAKKAIELEPGRDDYRRELALYEEMKMPGDK